MYSEIKKMNKIILAFTLLIGFSTASLQAQKPEICRAGSVDITIKKEGDISWVEGYSCLQLRDHFVWGGSVLRDSDGKYYMVYSAAEANAIPFTQAWVLGSKLGLAMSDFPDGGFKHLGFFYNTDGFQHDTSSWDAQTVVNPHLRKFNGKYYLYYSGSVDPGNKNIKSDTGTMDKRSRVQQNQKLGVIEFNSFSELLKGQFISYKQPLLTPRTRVKNNDIVDPSPKGTIPLPDNIILVNPSVVYRAYDKKYLLYFKGNIYDPGWRGVHGVAIADSPAGPFVPLNRAVFEVPVSEGEKLSAEDPYVWYCQKEHLFYAVFKDFTGRFTKQGPCLAIMYSEDGIDWHLPENSLFMKKELRLKSGEILKMDRLERPQILLDEEGIPQVLYSASSITNVNPRTEGCSFNVQIPLLWSGKTIISP